MLCGGLAALTWSCAPPSPELRHRSAQVVFGEDGRRDYYDVTDPVFADLLRRSTVAIVEPTYIDLSDPARVAPDTVTLGEYQSLCDGQAFAEQPAMASCSGALIDHDLVVTAGHCIDQAFCKHAYFVFGFYMRAPGELNPMSARDVYRCAEIVVREDRGDGDVWHDYAIVRLDRPVEGDRAPAPVEMRPDAVGVGDAITALGFGDGIPGKVHGGAVVNTVAHERGYFMGSTDTFAGNSGSAVYDSAHRIVGVFVRGSHEDYRREGSCQVVNTAPDAHATQEYSYAYRPVRALCERGYPSERLCGAGPGGGDSPARGGRGGEDLDAGSSEPWPSAGGATPPGSNPHPHANSSDHRPDEATEGGTPRRRGFGLFGCGVGAGDASGPAPPGALLLLSVASLLKRRRARLGR